MCIQEELTKIFHKCTSPRGSPNDPKIAPLLTSALHKRQDRAKEERSQLPLRECKDQKENA
jgi:hypothetical protein